MRNEMLVMVHGDTMKLALQNCKQFTDVSNVIVETSFVNTACADFTLTLGRQEGAMAAFSVWKIMVATATGAYLRAKFHGLTLESCCTVNFCYSGQTEIDTVLLEIA